MHRKLILAVALASAFAAPMSTAYAQEDKKEKKSESQLIAQEDKKEKKSESQLIAQEDKKEKKSESQLTAA